MPDNITIWLENQKQMTHSKKKAFLVRHKIILKVDYYFSGIVPFWPDKENRNFKYEKRQINFTVEHTVFFCQRNNGGGFNCFSDNVKQKRCEFEKKQFTPTLIK